MTRRTVAFVSSPETGHVARLRSLIAGVAAAGWRAVVFTDARFRATIEACGGAFHDLYGRIPVEAADAESIPFNVRQVSYAGHFAEDVTAELAAARPALVVHDSFSLVSAIAARRLGVPRVSVRSGHNLRLDDVVRSLDRDLRVRISPRCEEAVAILRDRHGLTDASPFSYVTNASPDLNLYCEPDEFLDPDVREDLAPVECIGSLGPPDARGRPGANGEAPPFGPEAAGVRKAYVSFGTVVWRFFEAEAAAALRAIVRALAARGDTEVLVSLGGYGVDVPGLAGPRVRVARYVDQWRVLGEADLFVTHHGLNSTHEAAARGVPMLSYPFFWDQPALAAKCAALGIAEPLARMPRAAISPADVERARARLEDDAGRRRERLAEVARWEERVVARRGEVIRRLLALAGAETAP